jgi:HPt (histidine-containing phosphotransfer) domain-containing protein
MITIPSDTNFPTGPRRSDQDYNQSFFQTHHTSVISLSYFGDAGEENKEFILEILKEFTRSVPKFLNHMETAIGIGDFSSVKSLIHDMKATVFVLGFADLIEPSMQFFETGDLKNTTTNLILSAFQHIKNICMKALEEAASLIRA